MITNATLAQQIKDLLDARITFETEHQTWLSGVVGGGPLSDGAYPLTSPVDGTIVSVKCPAQLEEDVNGLVTSASVSAANAALSETAALSAADDATTQVSLASAQRVLAEAAQAAASLSASQAATEAANAVTAWNNFSAQYLGASATDPTGTIQTGALYFNTGSNEMRVYNGSAWQAF